MCTIVTACLKIRSTFIAVYHEGHFYLKMVTALFDVDDMII